MKDNHAAPCDEISRVPELKVNKRCKTILECMHRIPYIYWITGLSLLLVFIIIFFPSQLWNYLWMRIRANWTLSVLILAFCIVSISLVWKTGERIDVWVFMAFNMYGQRPSWVDWSMLGITQIGNGLFAMGIAVIFFLRSNYQPGYEIILGTVTLWLVVELMKILIHRKRPYRRLKNMRVVGAKAGGHSFPSGHTSQSFFLATLLIDYYRIDFPTALVFYGIAGLVGITRMYVGMHYPRDVIGGAVLGTAWGFIGAIVNSHFF